MEKLAVSYIVPVYNVENYADRCLRSLHELQGEDIEFLVIDDGSEDSSGRICDACASEDRRFHVFHRQNAGVSAARNFGLAEAAGEWICFVDGDDYLLPEAHLKIRESLSSAYEIVFYGNGISAGGNEVLRAPETFAPFEVTGSSGQAGRLLYALFSARYLPQPLAKEFQGMAPPWGKYYRHDFLREHDLKFTEGIVRGQDLLFNAQAFQYLQKVLFLPVCGYVYIRNDASVTRKYSPSMHMYDARLLGALEHLFEKQEDETLRQVFESYKITILGHLLRAEYCHPDNPDSYRVRRKGFLDNMKQPVYQNVFRCSLKEDLDASKKLVCFLCRHRWFFLLNLIYRNVSLVRRIRKIRGRF